MNENLKHYFKSKRKLKYGQNCSEHEIIQCKMTSLGNKIDKFPGLNKYF